jgi:hypothetical protein
VAARWEFDRGARLIQDTFVPPKYGVEGLDDICSSVRFSLRRLLSLTASLICYEGAKLMSKNFVTGLFKTRVAAEAAVDAIIKRGYTRDDISVLMSDATKDKEFAVQTRSHAADGLGIGGAIGGTVGAVLATIVAVATPILIPGLGVLVAGPIAAALAGAGAGGATGGLIGLLIGTGIPEHRAKVYDTGVRGGGILLGVQAKDGDEVDKLETLLEDIGAEYVRTE